MIPKKPALGLDPRVETPGRSTQLGAKGIGESGLIGILPSLCSLGSLTQTFCRNEQQRNDENPE
jgi:hypothetical protein